MQIQSEPFNTGIIKSVVFQSVVAVLVSTAGQEVGKTKMKASETNHKSAICVLNKYMGLLWMFLTNRKDTNALRIL